MSVLQQIHKWSTQLKEWQSDAIRRLLQNIELSEEDKADIYALLKQEHGFPDDKGRKPLPLSSDNIPSEEFEHTQIVLKSIGKLIGVNAINSNQELSFGESGLTVVYGDNGVGKSGYSRVMRKACRARDQSNEILPNALEKYEVTPTPEATFTIKQDGVEQNLKWVSGTVSPAELSTITVFDSDCALKYIDKGDDFTYLPFGLEIFNPLKDLYSNLTLRVNNEIKAATVPKEALNHLKGETEVGRFILNITEKTSKDDAKKLATFTEDELLEKSEIEKVLKTLDPTQKIKDITNHLSRVKALGVACAAIDVLIQDSNLETIKDVLRKYTSAKKAADNAALLLKNDVGTTVDFSSDNWMKLFEAAKTFSTHSQSHTSIEDITSNDPCPLCQQPLNKAASLLTNFNKFIQEDFNKEAENHLATLNTHRDKFLLLNEIIFEEALRDEIKVENPELVTVINDFIVSSKIRIEGIKAAFNSYNFDNITSFKSDHLEKLRAYYQTLDNQKKLLEQTQDDEQKLKQEKRLQELSARELLAKSLDMVHLAIESEKNINQLKKCLKAIPAGNSVSMKLSEISNTVITEVLAGRLDVEFQKLGVENLKVKLETKIDNAQVTHTLKLQASKTAKLLKVLSEGEQRAIALASFFTQIGLGQTNGAIVLDDPVSSLDHARRESVAKRIIEEACKRQVIIFTHDIYFLHLLDDLANQAKIPIKSQSLNRRKEGTGIVNPDIPFQGMKTNDRLNYLEQRLKELKQMHEERDDEEYQKGALEAYFYLRKTWERAVEELLFNGVVSRFRKGVYTSSLSQVTVTDDDYSKIYQGMTRTSNYAHDDGPVIGAKAPPPFELTQDISALRNWASQFRKRKADLEKHRTTTVPTHLTATETSE